ncbi:hypothetical protein IKD82_00490, partial [Candidatus Saccharibacteria bacterium]|nr:hypothetical protein [Candidatus Saccharibacteria bacterium]
KTGGFTCGWTTTSTGATDFTYASGASVTPTASMTLYGVCKCPANTICYDTNATSGVVGTMGGQTITSSDTSAILIAPNYSRIDYGFAGWSTAPISPELVNNGIGGYALDIPSTTTAYGPNETISMSAGQYSANGLTLYAIWVDYDTPDYMQEWANYGSCNNYNDGDVLGLMDKRDDRVYAVAKLRDGNCWMIENLSLDTANSTSSSLAQGYQSGFTGLANPESASLFTTTATTNSRYSTNGATGTNTISGSNQAYRFPRYNNDNTSNRASNPSSAGNNLYGYGNYYTFAAANADTSDYTTNNHNASNTSICPAGWTLPIGGQDTVNETGEYSVLARDIMGYLTPNAGSNGYTYYQGISDGLDLGVTASNTIRSFPNNFTYSGNVYGQAIQARGTSGNYLTSTSYSGTEAYGLSFSSNYLYPGTYHHSTYSSKVTGWAVRCRALRSSRITLNKNGGTGGSNVTFAHEGSGVLDYITRPTRSGFTYSGFTTPATNGALNAAVSSTSDVVSSPTFAGWRQSSSSGSTLIASNASNPVLNPNTPYTDSNGKWTYLADTTLYATWANQTITLPTITKTGRTCGWTTESQYADTIMYASGATMTPTANTTLYGVCTCPSDKVCYDANATGVTGTMGNQSTSSTDSYGQITLLASNFSRSGYGFAGWIWPNRYDSEDDLIGPNEDEMANEINGVTLYAKWVQSSGNLQNWSGCSSLPTPDDYGDDAYTVIALTDSRDNNTYAITKLKDGKCWMMENLRLDAANSTNSTLAQGYKSPFTKLANAETANFSNSTTSNSVYSTSNITGSNQGYRFPRYNNTSTASRASYPTTANANIYGYGNYYTFAAANADTSDYTVNNSRITAYSICPKGWHIPSGGNKTNMSGNKSDFFNMMVAEYGDRPLDYNSSDTPYYNSDTEYDEGRMASDQIRSYPLNFVYNGRISGSSNDQKGTYGRYWSNTINSAANAYRLSFTWEDVTPGSHNNPRSNGMGVRCIHN